MKFKVAKSAFQDALQSAISAIPNKSTLQILNNFAFRLEGTLLEVTATDLDLGIRVKVEVEGERDGAVVVNARKLFDLIKNLVSPSISTIDFEVQDYLTTIRWSEHGKANITGFDASDFPPFPELEDAENLVVSGTELAFLADKTLFAVSTDTTRLTLNGVFLESNEKGISIVSTDGHRLGKANLEQENPTSIKNGVIVPPKAVQHVLRSVSNDSNIEVSVSDSYIMFNSDSIQVISKLIEGPYPKYENVIPKNFERVIQANTLELLNKIRSVMPMANPRTRLIRFQVDGNTLDLSASDSNIGGDSFESLAVNHEGEGSFSIGFNGQFISEILSMCKTEEVFLKMNNPVGACIVEPIGEGLNFFFLLMPLRLIE